MSRSNPTTTERIAHHYYTWDGVSGGFQYYDKATEKKLKALLPFTFLVLDADLATLKGGITVNKKYKGYYANEVKDITKDIFALKNSDGIVATGTYDEIKKNRACVGVKYCKSVYVATKAENGDLQIDNLQLMGSALSEFIEFCKATGMKKIEQGAVTVKEMKEEKNGVTVYQVPVFKLIETTPETNEQAKLLDVVLQEYLNTYFNSKKKEVEQTEHAHVAQKEAAEQGKYVASTEELEEVINPEDEKPF